VTEAEIAPLSVLVTGFNWLRVEKNDLLYFSASRYVEVIHVWLHCSRECWFQTCNFVTCCCSSFATVLAAAWWRHQQHLFVIPWRSVCCACVQCVLCMCAMVENWPS